MPMALETDIPEDLGRFGWVDVHVFHEPAWLVGTDGDGYQVNGTETLADFLNWTGLYPASAKPEADIMCFDRKEPRGMSERSKIPVLTSAGGLP